MSDAGRSIGEASRRDFLAVSAQSFVAVGTAAAIWPFIDQMNPHRGVVPLDLVSVDLDRIPAGQTVVASWRGRPVHIRHRTEAEIEMARAGDSLEPIDGLARNDALAASLKATDANRTSPGHERWLVVVGLCTHQGCALPASPLAYRPSEDIGWFCPCHASRFDHSGRVRGGPAQFNLAVPPYRFEGSRLVIGQA